MNLRNIINMKPQETQLKLQCPNCKSYNTSDMRHRKSSMFVMGLVATCFGLVIPFIGWFFLLPGGIIIMLASPFISNQKKATCKSCKYVFDITE